MSAASDETAEDEPEIQALLESEELRLLLSGVTDHAAFLLDPEGRVLSWNTGAERLKGYGSEEIIGQHFEVFFTPEERASGEPQRLLTAARDYGTVQSEAWRRRKDGSDFRARSVLTAVRDRAGRLRGFANIANDLSERTAEDEHRAIIIEAAPNGMLIVNEIGIISLANLRAHEILGYERGTLVRLSVDRLLPEDLPAGQRQLHEAFASGGDQDVLPEQEFNARRQDGSLVAVQVLVRPVRTQSGIVTIVSIFDLTDRRRRQQGIDAALASEREAAAAANARLARLTRHLAKARDLAEQASQAKSRFLTGITHELRTPLNGILGYAQLLRLEGNLNPLQVERVQAMVGAGEHLLGMINAVLDLSEIEADRLELQPVEIDLPVIARSCLDLIRPSAQAKGLTLDFEIASGPPLRLVADASRLRQLLFNLLGNAVKFTTSGGVRLRLLPSETGLRLEVADTGPGIAEKDRTRLFQEFDRLDADRFSAAEGSGLGLAITARLVQRMGGRIGHVENPGGGSVFWIELPAGSDPIATTVTHPKTEVCASARLRVLVVDDGAINRDVAAAFLRLGGHDVVCVDSGPAGIEAAASTDFDIILMDVRMPGMDGLEATRRIRALAGRRGEVPVLAVTAQAFTEQVEKCREAGMNGHVPKPLEKELFLRTVAAVASMPVGRSDPRVPAGADDAVQPSLDQATYLKTSGILDPAELETHLRTMTLNGESLLERLRSPDMLANVAEISDAAHAVGGDAGLFGFRQLAAAAGQFEGSAASGASDLVERASHLAETTRACLTLLRDMTAPAVAVVGAELEIFSSAALEQTAALLEAGVVASSLRLFDLKVETLLNELLAPNGLKQNGGRIAAAAHSLASSSGILGFKRLSVVARHFERAMENSPADIPAVAENLRATLKASLQELRNLTPTLVEA